jgi:hypothetical protein
VSRRICLIFALLSVLAPVRASAAQRPMQPISKWDLNYGDADCAAFRDYGNAEHPVTLAITPSPNGETYEILVVLHSAGPEFAQELEGSVDFGSGPIKAWLLHYESQTKSRFDVYRFRISAADMAQARSAINVTMHIRDAPDFAFKLESIPQLLSGLDACNADLKQYWNMDGEKNGRITTPAKADVRKIFSSDDYPAEAMNHYQEGDTQYLLLVDEKGKVAGCHVLIASGVPVLDAMGCIVIEKRARFTPALGPDGKPVRSTFVTPKVRWQIG